VALQVALHCGQVLQNHGLPAELPPSQMSPCSATGSASASHGGGSLTDVPLAWPRGAALPVNLKAGLKSQVEADLRASASSCHWQWLRLRLSVIQVGIACIPSDEESKGPEAGPARGAHWHRDWQNLKRPCSACQPPAGGEHCQCSLTGRLSVSLS
jgi:hypothetical protein